LIPAFRPGIRFWLLVLAALALSLALLRPTLALRQPVYRYAFVIDITQSMNVRDYHVPGMPADRLSFAKEALRTVLQDLPCGSEASLGLFTTQNVQLLFEPIEICRHLTLIEEVVRHIDWRIAWAANSHIAQGLYAGIREVQKLGGEAQLVFLTDGEQSPPLAQTPMFSGRPGDVKGLIVGVGGLHRTPIPKLDMENRMIGFWEKGDINPGSRFRQGADALDADAGQAADKDHEPYLSSLDESALKALAVVTGLRYHRLETPRALSAALRAREFGRLRTVDADVRWVLAVLALTSVSSLYLPIWQQLSKRR
jgi:mxaL protein